MINPLFLNVVEALVAKNEIRVRQSRTEAPLAGRWKPIRGEIAISGSAAGVVVRPSTAFTGRYSYSWEACSGQSNPLVNLRATRPTPRFVRMLLPGTSIDYAIPEDNAFRPRDLHGQIRREAVFCCLGTARWETQTTFPSNVAAPLRARGDRTSVEDWPGTHIKMMEATLKCTD